MSGPEFFRQLTVDDFFAWMEPFQSDEAADAPTKRLFEEFFNRCYS